MNWHYSSIPSLPSTPGRLFVSEDNLLVSPGNVPHPTPMQTTVGIIVAFLCAWKSTCSWATARDAVSRPKSSSVSFLTSYQGCQKKKTEQLIGNQPQWFPPSLQAIGNFFFSFISNSICPVSVLQLLPQLQWMLQMLTQELIFFCCCSFCLVLEKHLLLPGANTTRSPHHPSICCF